MFRYSIMERRESRQASVYSMKGASSQMDTLDVPLS